MTNQSKETLFRELVGRTLAKMPSEFEDWVMRKIIIVFPREKNLATTVIKEDSKHYEAVIILFDELLGQEDWFQEHSLLNEIAHVKLKHRTQDDAEKRRKQENEANALASKWLVEAKSREARQNRKS
jgi:hypothetical protein